MFWRRPLYDVNTKSLRLYSLCPTTSDDLGVSQRLRPLSSQIEPEAYKSIRVGDVRAAGIGWDGKLYEIAFAILMLSTSCMYIEDIFKPLNGVFTRPRPWAAGGSPVDCKVQDSAASHLL